jgi:hypothetical protein
MMIFRRLPFSRDVSSAGLKPPPLFVLQPFLVPDFGIVSTAPEYECYRKFISIADRIVSYVL